MEEIKQAVIEFAAHKGIIPSLVIIGQRQQKRLHEDFRGIFVPLGISTINHINIEYYKVQIVNSPLPDILEVYGQEKDYGA